ncbi:hypothetical protein BXT86_05685 [candidate division WOR-3 bacterium 4484_100]|uniref:Ligand-binding protein SH3 n=1 Tax=candidate division WOR-3 bacterium 4484_100 TaxID=1936077 RepID=A0A1V4QF31_UNCW3|nr:MAG: hypothetical protein BXT86_05685 [candidate division WOR-3 bacterium 4484_100]
MNPQDLVARGFTPELAVFITSMLPIIELRGSLPLAINLFRITWPKAFLIAFIGNIIPVPFIIILLKPMVQFLSKIAVFKKFFDWLFARTRRKGGDVIRKYKEVGLLAFVAIPLPGTGAWTGALIAFLFDLEFKLSVVIISLGVFIAGIIVLSLCLLGWIGAVIAVIIFSLAALGFLKL